MKRDTGKGINENYNFICMIGAGAFSKVYLAEDKAGQRYACKVSREMEMLEREAGILGRLYHPLFPEYIDYEEKEGVGYLVMEYISGRNLGQQVRLRGGFSARQAMRIAEELAGGLRYLHERRPTVLYRDLKPENIMVCEDGHIKLIDFGCACYQDTQGGVKVGTPGFAPPEQMEGGGAAGIYSDVYSLGKTVESVMAGAKKRHSAEIQCRRRLERMIEAATREDFRRRPQDMIEVEHILTGKRKKEKGIVCEKNIWETSCGSNLCAFRK